MIPDRVGVVAGYRWWRVTLVQSVPIEESLQALRFRYTRGAPVWSLDAPTLAQCPYGNCRADMHPPSFGCICGLHARPTPLPTRERYHAEEYHPWSLDYMEIYGSVLAWGRTVYHADHSFFRAEKALPIALVSRKVPDRLWQIGERLAAPILPSVEDLVEYTNREAELWSG